MKVRNCGKGERDKRVKGQVDPIWVNWVQGPQGGDHIRGAGAVGLRPRGLPGVLERIQVESNIFQCKWKILLEGSLA